MTNRKSRVYHSVSKAFLYCTVMVNVIKLGGDDVVNRCVSHTVFHDVDIRSDSSVPHGAPTGSVSQTRSHRCLEDRSSLSRYVSICDYYTNICFSFDHYMTLKSMA